MLHIMERTEFEDKQALIVEDDAHNLLALGSLLKGLKIHYKRNTTGADVLQQAQRVRPDFILLDMDLPYGDPFAIYARLRKDSDLKDVPVIAIGESRLLKEFQPRILKSGFAGYLAKPIAPRALEDLLKMIFRGHTRH
jgi:CheY-like chemotaxis protein